MSEKSKHGDITEKRVCFFANCTSIKRKSARKTVLKEVSWSEPSVEMFLTCTCSAHAHYISRLRGKEGKSYWAPLKTSFTKV